MSIAGDLREFGEKCVGLTKDYENLRKGYEAAWAETDQLADELFDQKQANCGAAFDKGAAIGALENVWGFLDGVRMYGALRSEVDVPKLFLALRETRTAIRALENYPGGE
jgi:hypothetical protein